MTRRTMPSLSGRNTTDSKSRVLRSIAHSAKLYIVQSEIREKSMTILTNIGTKTNTMVGLSYLEQRPCYMQTDYTNFVILTSSEVRVKRRTFHGTNLTLTSQNNRFCLLLISIQFVTWVKFDV